MPGLVIRESGPGIRLAVDTLSALRSLKDVEVQANKMAQDVAKEVAAVIENEAQKQVLIARSVNVQDDPRGIWWRPNRSARVVTVTVGQGRNLGTGRFEKGVSYHLHIEPYWMNARRQALVSSAYRLGLDDLITRPGIFVQPSVRNFHHSYRNRPKRAPYKTTTGLVYMEMHEERIGEWARRPDKGYHIRRNAVFLNSMLLRDLVLEPTLASSRGVIERVIANHLRR